MKSNQKKTFIGSHIKSSAFFVSLIVHVVIIIVSLTFVAVQIHIKPEATFKPAPPKKPKMQARKLKVPKKEKKKIKPPKLQKRIVVKSPKFKMTNFQMPEVSGVKGGIGYDGDSGLGDIGFGIDLFGGSKSLGSDLAGTFYDFKQDPDQQPRRMDDERFIHGVQAICRGFSKSKVEKFFVAPQRKYATAFYISNIRAKEAPKAFGVDKYVKPKHWMAYYKGRIAAPHDGRFRFCGYGDDVLVVKLNGKVVVDASHSGYADKRVETPTNWKAKDPMNRKIPMMNGHQLMAIGNWVNMKKGYPFDIEIILGECPGLNFCSVLLIEEEGVSYKTATTTVTTGRGKQKKQKKISRKVLPIFKTAPISAELASKMKIDKTLATAEGPVFSIVKSQ